MKPSCASTDSCCKSAGIHATSSAPRTLVPGSQGWNGDNVHWCGTANAGDPRPYQPPGYIISPSTFIPCEPDALEMLALHSVHTLLSCKDALGRYIEQHRDENGEPLLTEAEFDEVIHDYEAYVHSFSTISV